MVHHPPLMLYAQTCGGSSFAYAFLTYLLMSVNIHLADVKKELTKAERMKSIIQGNGWEYTNVSHGMWQIYEDLDDEVMLFMNPHFEPWDADFTDFLKKTDAKIVMVHRNVVDHLLCSTRDCFPGIESATPVFENGTDADLCFARRGDHWLSGVQKIKNPAPTPANTMVNFDDIQELKEYLYDPRFGEENMTLTLLEHGAWIDGAFSSEDLAAFEFERPSETPSLVTKRSISSWKRLLTAFGFSYIDEDAIHQKMLSWMRRQPPRNFEPYGHRVYNCNEIKDLLRPYGYFPLGKPADPCT